MFIILSEEVWTEQDEAVFRPLYRKWQRIRSRVLVDRQMGGRKRRFGPKKYKPGVNEILQREGASEVGQ